MSDIAKRLRSYANPNEWAERSLIPKLLTDAADEIEQLGAERDALRARIDGAPRGNISNTRSNGIANVCNPVGDWPDDFWGKRVALVPLDD